MWEGDDGLGQVVVVVLQVYGVVFGGRWWFGGILTEVKWTRVKVGVGLGLGCGLVVYLGPKVI